MKNEFIENPEVGKFYLVTCVLFVGDTTWFPVLPHQHTDKQFTGGGTDKAHYHFDLRFCSPAVLGKIINTSIEDDGIRRANSVAWASRIKAIGVRRRKCRAANTGIGVGQFSRFRATAQEWYRKQIGKSCAGAVCPHYRQPMFRRADGKLECPYHGLVGDAETEKIIGCIHSEE